MTLWVWVRIVHVPPCCSCTELQKPFNAGRDRFQCPMAEARLLDSISTRSMSRMKSSDG
jgi:hypothetical protein